LPNHKACEKRLRQSQKENQRNSSYKSILRRTEREYRQKLAAGEEIDLSTLYSLADKASGKKVVHRKKAARMKSRLARLAAKKAKSES
jgi:small subunit ribosomal protein S20